MLEQKSECKHKFALEDGGVFADGKGEDDHGQCRYGGHEKPELQDVDEQAAMGRALAEIGENKRCHAKIGDGVEYGKVALQDSERPEFYNSEVICDKILDKNRNSLDKDIDQGYENADFNVPKCLQRAIK